MKRRLVQNECGAGSSSRNWKRRPQSDAEGFGGRAEEVEWKRAGSWFLSMLLPVLIRSHAARARTQENPVRENMLI